MKKLSVNINKIATLRNARGGNLPDVVKAAIDIQHFGADGITVHPRPDGRHIRTADVCALRKVVTTEFNVEGYPSEDFLAMVIEVKPEQVTLVPDPPGALTSNAGWDCKKNHPFLAGIVERLKMAGIRTSIFLEPDISAVKEAALTGTDRIELYTEQYAKEYLINPESAVKPFREAALAAGDLGLGINAGHDLALNNLAWFSQQVPGLLEVSIGHALICDALYLGLENAVAMYRRELLLV
jgi:pyridoxine 5-phosphate synthase